MAFPPGEYLMDELRARGWSLEALAGKMGGAFEERKADKLALELLVNIPQRGLLLGRETAERLSQALGTSAELWLRLDAAWQASPESEAARIALEAETP
jgi:plasmid maintenance system antidote protein VapI